MIKNILAATALTTALALPMNAGAGECDLIANDDLRQLCKGQTLLINDRDLRMVSAGNCDLVRDDDWRNVCFGKTNLVRDPDLRNLAKRDCLLIKNDDLRKLCGGWK